MPHTPERLDPTRTDFRAAGERDTARELRRKSDGITAKPPLAETPPLKRRCDGPGCGMSKSAFASTEEFDAHRLLCETFPCAGWCNTRHPLADGAVITRGGVAAIMCGPCLARALIEVHS